MAPPPASLWLFEVNLGRLHLTNTFYVSGQPALSVQSVPNSPTLELCWPVMNGTFVLEFMTDCLAGNWQVVTDAPVLTNNVYSVQFDASSGNQFFRLRQR